MGGYFEQEIGNVLYMHLNQKIVFFEFYMKNEPPI